MKISIVIPIIALLAAAASAQPIITPVNFLNTDEPERMCQNYIDAEFGENYMPFAQPTGGAVIRINMGNHEHIKYIFCDAPFNRLMIYSLDDYSGERVPAGVKGYGREIEAITFQFDDGATTVSPPHPQRDSVGCFNGPVDIVVSSKGKYFEPGQDLIYVLDQGNLRVVVLSYDPETDSLIWERTFGELYLDMPTAIDYASYDDPDYDNHDVYITDGVLSKIFRFSASGEYEDDFGSWGSGLGSIGYPTGIAVAPFGVSPNTFYATDSRNHRVVKYHSESTGPIQVESRYIFSLQGLNTRYVKGIDIDASGNVYVIDNFTNNVTVLAPDLSEVLLTFNPVQFNHPSDIYIDGEEMVVCERWGESSGIQSFTVLPGQPKLNAGEFPKRFYLYQNYPNPFNSSTTIKFDLPKDAEIQLAVYNILGQRVVKLADESFPAGTHYIQWNGTNQNGGKVASGIYFYSITSKRFATVKKLLLLK